MNTPVKYTSEVWLKVTLQRMREMHDMLSERINGSDWRELHGCRWCSGYMDAVDKIVEAGDFKLTGAKHE